MATIVFFEEHGHGLLELPRDARISVAVGHELKLAIGGAPTHWKIVRVRHVVVSSPGPTYSVCTQAFVERIEDA